jgi:hypothetical protein
MPARYTRQSVADGLGRLARAFQIFVIGAALALTFDLEWTGPAIAAYAMLTMLAIAGGMMRGAAAVMVRIATIVVGLIMLGVDGGVPRIFIGIVVGGAALALAAEMTRPFRTTATAG